MRYFEAMTQGARRTSRRATSRVWLAAVLTVLIASACSAPVVSQSEDEPPALLEPTRPYVSLNGTTSTDVKVQAEGYWSVETHDGGVGWLQVEPSEGFGDATLTVSADRRGINPSTYNGEVRMRGPQANASVGVLMRFPEVSGAIVDATADLSPAGFDVDAKQARPLGTAGIDRVPGELLVELDTAVLAAMTQGPGAIDEPDAWDANAAAGTAANLANDHDLDVVRAVKASTPVFLLAAPEQNLESALNTIKADARVAYAEPNGLYQPAFLPSDPRYRDQAWHYEAIRLPEAWDLTRGEANVTVAVIDSGFDTEHPDLAGNLLPGRNFTTGADTADLAGHECAVHGTHVAGTIAALDGNGVGGLGVAPRVKILPLAIGTPKSDGSCPLDTAAFMEAVRYASGVGEDARATPVDVINLSIGGPKGSFVEARALSDAVGNGVVVVASSGNDAGTVLYPAAYPSTVAVGATDVNNDVTFYSNRGVALDVVAPGGTRDQGVFSTVDQTYGSGYAHFAGTSMAAPHVAGVAALMRSVNPGLTVTDVRSILEGTATDLGPLGWDTNYGYGIIDAAAALALSSDGADGLTEALQIQLTNDDSSFILQTVADANREFVLKNVPEGSYRLKARVDPSTQPGSYTTPWLADEEVAVSYTGDTVFNLAVDYD